MNSERAIFHGTAQALCGGRVVAYYPGLARRVGGVKAAVMLSQLLYWSGVPVVRQRGGWLYKSVEEMERETGLTKAEQQTARKALLALGLVEARLKGIPRTWFYRVDLPRLAALVEAPGANDLPGADELPGANDLPGADELPGANEPLLVQPATAETLPGKKLAADPLVGIQTEAGQAQYSEKYLPPIGTVREGQSHQTASSLNGTPAGVGRQSAPILGGSSAQLNKESKNTTEITREIGVRNGKIVRSEPPAAKTGPPRDPRMSHPAVLLVKNVTGRYPPTVLFDRLIKILGDHPDAARFAAVHEAWCLRGYRTTNLEGHLDWYQCGIPTGGGFHSQGPPVDRPARNKRSEAELNELRARVQAAREAMKQSAGPPECERFEQPAEICSSYAPAAAHDNHDPGDA